jgi:MFS family permease
MDAVLLSWVATAFCWPPLCFSYHLAVSPIFMEGRKYSATASRSTVSSLLAAISVSGATLIGARILQGFGGAMIFGTGVAILTSVYPPGERGKALGINVAAVYFGLTLGPFFGGFLTQHWGWRSIFLANLPVGVLLIALTLWKLRGEWAEAKGEKFDLIGAIIYALTLIAIMLGFSLLPSQLGGWATLHWGLGILAFIKWEMKAQSPVLSLHLFNNTVFTFSNLAALIHYSATFALTFLLSLYLQYIKGLTPQTAGFILVSQPMVMTIFSPFAGKLSDRIEPRIVASIGMALSAAGLFLFTFLEENMALASIIAGLMLLDWALRFFFAQHQCGDGAVEKILWHASGTLVPCDSPDKCSVGCHLDLCRLSGESDYAGKLHSLMKSIRLAFTVFAVLVSAVRSPH